MARTRKPEPDDPEVWKGVFEDIDNMSREELLARFRENPLFDEAWVTGNGATEAAPGRPSEEEEQEAAPASGRRR